MGLTINVDWVRLTLNTLMPTLIQVWPAGEINGRFF